jgi:LPS export ABC transporter permease LptG
MRNLRWYAYIWSQLTGPTTLALALWTFVLLMNAFFLVAEQALAKNLGWELTARMFAAHLPRVLVLAIPMAVLLGALITVGRIAADHEWVALQGAGHGPAMLMRPLLVFGIAATLLGLAIFGWAHPRANYAGRKLYGEAAFLSNLASDLRPGVFYTRLPGTVLFVSNVRSQGDEGRLEGVIVHRRVEGCDRCAHPRQNHPGGGTCSSCDCTAYAPSEPRDELYLARYGDLFPLPDGSGMLGMRLVDGVQHRYGDGDEEGYVKGRFQRLMRPIPAHQFMRTIRDDPTRSGSDMTPPELWEEIRAVAADPALHPKSRSLKLRLLEFELHRRFALPAASLLFAGLALPLGVGRARSGKGAGLALSLLVILLYWVVFTFAQGRVARSTEVPVWVWAWAANMVVFLWAVLAYWRMCRSRGGIGLLGRLFNGIAWLRHRVRRRRMAATGSPAARPLGAGEDPEAHLPLAGTPNRFIARVDQYIVMRYLQLTLLTLAAAYVIYTVVDLRRLLEYMLRHGHPMSLLLEYFALAIPGMLRLTLPISCLVGGVVTFTLLSRTGELTAIKAAGISMRRAVVPVLLVTAVLCAGMFLFDDKIELPLGGDRSVTVGWAISVTTNQRADEVRDEIQNRSPSTKGMPAGGRWALGPKGERLYHYRMHDPEQGLFQGLSVFEVDRATPRILSHRFTPLARWTGTAWSFDSGWYREFGADESIVYEQLTEQESAAWDPPDTFSRREALAGARSSSTLQEQMSSQDLLARIDELASSGYDTSRLRVALWGKLAQTLTPLVMVLLGLPFAFKVGRRGSLYGIGVAILLVIVYWGTFAVFNALGLETILPPLLAAWTPNVLYGLLGTYLLLYVST